MVSRQLVESQPYLHEQHDLVGRLVSKPFLGWNCRFTGKIIHFNTALCPEHPFHVSFLQKGERAQCLPLNDRTNWGCIPSLQIKYDDGDEEDVTEAEYGHARTSCFHQCQL